MVLYTDGVTEARGPDGMLGADELKAVLGLLRRAGCEFGCGAH